MNELNNIMEYLDGELNPTEERALFLSLAENDSLRSQMRQLYSVNYSLNSNRNYFAPSAQATMGVFGSLGLSGKYLGLNAASGHGAAGWVSANLLNKSALFGALIAFLMSAAGYFILDRPIWGDANMSTGQHIANTVLNIPAIQNNSNSGKGKTANSINAKEPEQVIKYIYLTKTEDRIQPQVSFTKTELPERPTEPNPEHKPIGTKEFASKPDEIPEKTVSVPHATAIYTLPDNITEKKADYNIEIEYRGAFYRNLPAEIIEPDRQAHFDNSSITFLYNISDEFSIGADLRQERFYQIFDGKTSDGMPAKYIQQPNFTTMNLLARYSPGEYLGLKPFLQAETGYARSGWINRAAAGLGFKIADPLEFVLIGEYSHFLFNNSNKLFTSEKIGFLYGINIKF